MRIPKRENPISTILADEAILLTMRMAANAATIMSKYLYEIFSCGKDTKITNVKLEFPKNYLFFGNSNEKPVGFLKPT
jgi:hypothetical protein